MNVEIDAGAKNDCHVGLAYAANHNAYGPSDYIFVGNNDNFASSSASLKSRARVHGPGADTNTLEAAQGGPYASEAFVDNATGEIRVIMGARDIRPWDEAQDMTKGNSILLEIQCIHKMSILRISASDVFGLWDEQTLSEGTGVAGDLSFGAMDKGVLTHGSGRMYAIGWSAFESIAKVTLSGPAGSTEWTIQPNEVKEFEGPPGPYEMTVTYAMAGVKGGSILLGLFAWDSLPSFSALDQFQSVQEKNSHGTLRRTL